MIEIYSMKRIFKKETAGKITNLVNAGEMVHEMRVVVALPEDLVQSLEHTHSMSNFIHRTCLRKVLLAKVCGSCD